jgi:hypothetical protein
MAAKGISHSTASWDVLGIPHVVTRTNFGEEFPIASTDSQKQNRTKA